MALKAGYKGIKKCGPGLKYDNVNGILSLEGESSLKLDNLEDVAITTPLQGDVLIYDGEDWVNEQPDTDPTEDSANLVSSGGVYDALQARVDWSSYAKTGVHNQFPYPYVGGSADGGDFTVNADKTITASGTFTGNSEYRIMDYITDNRYEGWIISSNAEFSEDFYIRIREALSDGTFVREIRETNGQIIIPHMDSGHKYYIGVRVGTTGSAINVTLKPTLSVPGDTYKGYTEPTMTNKELTEKKVDKSAILLNASNDLNDIKNENQVGYYRWESAYPVNSPENKTWSIMQMLYYGGGVKQIVYYGSDNIYIRQYVGSTWSSWYKFTGTVVS